MMPYQPNYCNFCGEKVERDKWNLFTSEHFCENCEGSFRKTDWKSKIYLAIGILGGLFGFGSYLKTPEKPLALVNNQWATNVSNRTQTVRNEQVTVNTNVSKLVGKTVAENKAEATNQAITNLSTKAVRVSNQSENPQIVESEPVYFCGAQTKKGTPCTRKVKGGGRCWQHTGLSAMLPKEKLVSNQ